MQPALIVISEKAVAYEGFIRARATGEDGRGAYKIGLQGAGLEQPGQWHKAGDVFVPEPVNEDDL
jgi:hypothetical protein